MLNVIMSVLTNIKYQYNLRILQDFISSNNYSDFFAQLEKLKGNNKLYTQLLTTLGSSAILDNKLILIQNNQLVTKNKLAICGNPRFDLSKPIFRNFYLKKKN